MCWIHIKIHIIFFSQCQLLFDALRKENNVINKFPWMTFVDNIISIKDVNAIKNFINNNEKK